MIDLAFHDMLWCPWSGHPVLVLEAKERQLCFAVSVSADDAQALAVVPHGNGAARVRGLSMLAEAATQLGARIAGVTLAFGPGGVLCAEISLAAGTERFALSSHFSDGLILARHASAPLGMTDATFAQIDAAAVMPISSFSQRRREDEPAGGIAEPFRAVIESLDMSGFSRPASWDGEQTNAD
ncbi:MAG: bifunctional nuclease domain-containing protein [Thermomicrobiales bacterium]